VWAGPISQAIGRYVSPCRESAALGSLLATSRRLFWVCSAAHGGVLLVLIAGGALLAQLDRTLAWVYSAGVILSIIESGFAFTQTVRVQLRKRREVALNQALFALTRPLLAALLLSFLAPTALVALVGYLIATLLLTAVQARLVRRLEGSSDRYSAELKTKLLKFSAPYLSWGLLGWLTISGDRWILSHFTSAGVVGLYVAALQVGTVVPMIAGQVISTFVSPVLNDRVGFADDRERVKKTCLLLVRCLLSVFVLGMAGMVIVSIFREELLMLLTGAQYRAVAYAVPWLYLGNLFIQMAQFSFGIGPILFRPAAFVIPRNAAYIVTIMLMIWLSKTGGIRGLVAAYCIGGLLQFLVTAAVAVLIYRRHMSEMIKTPGTIDAGCAVQSRVSV